MAFPTSDMPGHGALRERVQAALDRAIEAPDVDFKESAPWEAGLLPVPALTPNIW